ncbi:MAG: hypothetical protein RR056_02115 [Acetivibrio sp.]
MDLIKKWKQKIKRFMGESQSYFNNCKNEITLKNFRMLKLANVLQLLMVAVYFVVAAFTFHSRIINLIYMVYVVCDIIFTIYIFGYLKKERRNFKRIQRACWTFDTLCMGFIILISVYPLVNDPGIFFLIMIVFIPIIFILPFTRMIGFVTGSEVIFFILASLIKTENAFHFDMASSITAWIFAMVATYIINDVRIYDNQMNRELGLTRSKDKSPKV